MLYRELLSAELALKHEDFSAFAQSQAVEIDAYLQKLRDYCDRAEQEDAILAAEEPGAIPSSEIKNGSFVSLFEPKWKNHESSRKWADQVLSGRTTFAADGSQLYVQKETSLPVGAVQVGWFENPHDPEKKYTKEVLFELLSPRSLLENQEEPLNPETRVGERRFHMEIEKVSEFLDKKKDWNKKGERMPVAFFDGTLLVSFSLPQTSFQKGFLSAIVDLVKKSCETHVPIVGYVDRSFAKDIVAFLNYLDPELENAALYDAALLSTRTSNNGKILENWGDRTIFCSAKRRGLEIFNDLATGKPTIGFSYLQTTGDSSPARLDIPVWVYDAGLLEELVDVVRAECVVGLGYPYALEAADATALITNRDREVFIAALREFTSQKGLDFAVSRKGASKARRR